MRRAMYEGNIYPVIEVEKSGMKHPEGMVWINIERDPRLFDICVLVDERQVLTEPAVVREIIEAPQEQEDTAMFSYVKAGVLIYRVFGDYDGSVFALPDLDTGTCVTWPDLETFRACLQAHVGKVAFA